MGDPRNPSIQYRFTRGVAIDGSRDSGQTWQQEFNLGDEEARVHFIQSNDYSLPVGPFDAVIHPASGNLVVAMGREGVLIRTAQGEWRWIAVGAYSMPEFNLFGQMFSLLSGEIGLAVVLLLLTISTVAFRARLADKGHARQRLMAVLLVGSWSGWIVILLGFKPAVYSRGQWNPYPDPMLLAIGVVAVLAIVLAFRRVQMMRREHRCMLVPALIIAVTTMLVFLLPYVLWTQGVIPFYTSATFYAMALTAAVVVGGRLYVRRFASPLDVDA